MLATHHNTHSGHILTLFSIGIATKPRCLPQLLPPTAMQWFSRDHHPVDHQPVHTYLLITRSPAPIIDCDYT